MKQVKGMYDICVNNVSNKMKTCARFFSVQTGPQLANNFLRDSRMSGL